MVKSSVREDSGTGYKDPCAQGLIKKNIRVRIGRMSIQTTISENQPWGQGQKYQKADAASKQMGKQRQNEAGQKVKQHTSYPEDRTQNLLERKL